MSKYFVTSLHIATGVTAVFVASASELNHQEFGTPMVLIISFIMNFL